MSRVRVPLFLAVSIGLAQIALAPSAVGGPHDALITKHAAANGVPEALVRRVIHIESRGNPGVVSKGNFGLMQIRLGTARAMGYSGTAQGLLDADTNMTYAVKYLAGAYRAAGCNESRAVSYYQRGYYKAPQAKCRVPQPTQIARSETDASARPATVTERGQATSAPSTAATGDVLRPKVVQTQLITKSRSASSAAAQTVGKAEVSTSAVPSSVSGERPWALMQEIGNSKQRSAQTPAAKPELVAMPQAVAKLDAERVPVPRAVKRKLNVIESQSSPEPVAPEVVASLGPDAAPLPQPRPQVMPAAPSKPRTAHRRVRVAKKTEQPSGLMALLKKLVTPEKPTRVYRRR